MARYNVLFLCTRNSARSIFAEVLLNYWGKGRFHAYSAGSEPSGEIHPLTIQLLERNYLAAGRLRSKSWAEFAVDGAPRFDFVFTVCDRAAEACLRWPGDPVIVHWGMPDPIAAGSDDDRERAFARAFLELDARIKAFATLPLNALDEMTLRRQLTAIGASEALW
jgi:arsenate reductase